MTGHRVGGKPRAEAGQTISRLRALRHEVSSPKHVPALRNAGLVHAITAARRHAVL